MSLPNHLEERILNTLSELYGEEAVDPNRMGPSIKIVAGIIQRGTTLSGAVEPNPSRGILGFSWHCTNGGGHSSLSIARYSGKAETSPPVRSAGSYRY